MNSIASTELFKNNEKIFMEPLNTLQTNLRKYAVPKELLSSYLSDLKSYKFRFAPATREYIEARKIIPIISEDPVNRDDKKVILRYAILIFGGIINKEFIGVPNLSLRSMYRRDSTPEKNPVDMTISSRDFYILCEGATVLKLLNDNKGKIINSPKLNNMLINFFSYILSKTIDKTFSFGRDSNDDYSILMYITAFYFCQCHLQMNSKRAESYVRSALRNVVDFDYINSNFLIYNEDLNISNLTDLVEKLKTLPQIRSDKFDKRLLMSLYARNIGENAIFSLEHYFSFIFVLLASAANKKSKLFNDHIISRIISNKRLNDFEKILKEVLL